LLTNKVILIISPQSWGKMMLAKHHYALELAKKGNQVYYLNPPDNFSRSWNKNRIKIAPVPGQSNLFVIDQQLYFPYKLKFHFRSIYDVLIKKQIRDILKSIPKPIDIIWSFDLGNLFPLRFFDSKYFKVFHPVDEPASQQAIDAADSANILFSVTREILGKYESKGIPAYFINHGMAEEFLNPGPFRSGNGQVKVGLSGNFLRPDLDRKILLQIIKENPAVIFHFYGSYAVNQSNIGAGEDGATKTFIETLQSEVNIQLHGVMNSRELARELNRMDAFLICYNILLDQSRGTNYHKVMEYLSTGKVIISNNITTYQEFPELIRMTTDREHNDNLPRLFNETIADLEKWNAIRLMNERRAFASNNTYDKQLRRIELILASQP
jgi:hypothetical protein